MRFTKATTARLGLSARSTPPQIAGSLAGLFVLPADMGPVDVEVNRLDNQVLVRYYDSEWRKWN